MKKIAINGFGRIGRLALRRILELDKDNYEVVAINDPMPNDALAYVFKYDTAFGMIKEDVSFDHDVLKVDDFEIKMYSEYDAKDLPWEELGVDLVLECSGFYTDVEKAKSHLEAGAKQVLVSAPIKGDAPMVVFGVNDDVLDGSHDVVSAASCTTNCLAPVVNVLNKEFGIEVANMVTIHAYTASQALQDGVNKKNFRLGRAAALNMVPTTTGAARAIGKVIPELDGKIDGSAIRVPTITGSLVEVFATLEKEVTVEELNQAFAKSTTEAFAYTEEPIVSSDVIGVPIGSILDAGLTEVVENGDKQLVKIGAWYDNEYGYTSNYIRVAERMLDLQDA